MRITKNVKSPTELTLIISADTADLEPIKRHVLNHFAREVKVPGFRAGKAPAHMVEKNIDQKRLLDEFLEHALNELYTRALDAEKLRTVAAPNVNLKKFVPFSELEFEAEMETVSPIKLGDYKKLKVSKKPVTVNAKDVTEVLDSLRQRLAERIEVDRPAKKGDEVLIDFSGTDRNGHPVSGASADDYPLNLGSDTFIPGFEDHLAGAKAGESKEFTIKFPADYNVAALRGRNVIFKVSIKKVSETAEAKADDVFAAKVGPFNTLTELKADIKNQIKSERQAEVDREFENELVRALSAKSSVEIPDSLVEQQINRMEEEEKRNLAYRGQTWQEHLKEEGITEEQHRERHRDQAIERVKGGLILSEVAEQENVEVTPQELEIRLQILKSQYQDPAMQAELDKPENRREVAARLMTEKTVAQLASYANKN